MHLVWGACGVCASWNGNSVMSDLSDLSDFSFCDFLNFQTQMMALAFIFQIHNFYSRCAESGGTHTWPDSEKPQNLKNCNCTFHCPMRASTLTHLNGGQNMRSCCLPCLAWEVAFVLRFQRSHCWGSSAKQLSTVIQPITFVQLCGQKSVICSFCYRDRLILVPREKSTNMKWLHFYCGSNAPTAEIPVQSSWAQ